MKLSSKTASIVAALAFAISACSEGTDGSPAQSSGGNASGGAGVPSGAGAPMAGTHANGGSSASAGAAGAVTGGNAGVGGAGGTSNTAGTEHGGAGGASGGAATAGGGAGGASGGTAGASSGGMAGAAGGGAWMFPAGVTKPRIMIVGDSISAGPGCYKKALLKELTDHGYTAFEFVGEYNDDCGGGVKHSAVSCSTAAQYTQASFMVSNCKPGVSFAGMAPLAAKYKPDLIMLQLGVNDVWGNAPTATILNNYKTLVEQARAQNPQVALVVAQIQKIRPDCGTDDSVQKRAEQLVMAVPAWAKQLDTPQSPVFVADLWTNSDWSKAETLDCVHPNDIGAQRMGTNWFNALKNILKPG